MLRNVFSYELVCAVTLSPLSLGKWRLAPPFTAIKPPFCHNSALLWTVSLSPPGCAARDIMTKSSFSSLFRVYRWCDKLRMSDLWIYSILWALDSCASQIQAVAALSVMGTPQLLIVLLLWSVTTMCFLIEESLQQYVCHQNPLEMITATNLSLSCCF